MPEFGYRMKSLHTIFCEDIIRHIDEDLVNFFNSTKKERKVMPRPTIYVTKKEHEKSLKLLRSEIKQMFKASKEDREEREEKMKKKKKKSKKR